MLFFPNIAYASIDPIVAGVTREIINPLILFLFAAAVGYFLLGLLKFFMNPTDEEARTNGKSSAGWGLFGMFFMFGVWFWISLILRTANINYIKIDQQNNEGVIKIEKLGP